ncbi:MAG: STAS/SEC14 domain-containing protein [Rhodothalassiaceae bacterium]
MLQTQTIRQIKTDQDHVLAFHVTADVRGEDMAALGRVLQKQFDLKSKVNMLLILEDFEPADSAKGLSLDSLTAQMRSLDHLEKYAVIGPPPAAATLLKLFDKVSDIEVRPFKPDQDEAAWAFIGARPMETGSA